MSKITDDWNSFLDEEETTEKKNVSSQDDFQDIMIDSKPEEEMWEEVQKPVRRSASRRRDDFEFEDEDPEEDFEDEDDELDDDARPSDKKSGFVTVLIAVLAILAVIAVAIVAAKLLSKSNSSDTTASEEAQESTVAWEQNTNSEVLSLVNQYYAARVLGETYTLQNILDPSITIDEESLKNESEVIEGYQEIACYTTDGRAPGEYVVYITYNLKFKNISTPAPGLVCAYIYTDDAGSLRLIPREYLSDEDENFKYIAEVSNCDFIKELAARVDENYLKARKTDAGLEAYLQSIGAVPVEGDDTTSADTTTAPNDTTSAATTAASSDNGFAAANETMYVTGDSVRVRQQPNTNEGTAVVTTLSKGTAVTVTGKGSEWYKVSVNGSEGYIKKDFLSSTKPSASASTTTASSSSESFTDTDDMMFVNKDSVNVRKAPNTNEGTEVIKTLSKGTQIQVTGKGSEWYRVNLADGSTGYIKKEFLSADAPN